MSNIDAMFLGHKIGEASELIESDEVEGGFYYHSFVPNPLGIEFLGRTGKILSGYIELHINPWKGEVFLGYLKTLASEDIVLLPCNVNYTILLAGEEGLSEGFQE